MKEVAPGVWRLDQFPGPIINVYLVGNVLIDAGRTWDRRRILRQIEGVKLSLLALTHAHADHQGLAGEVCQKRGISLACHEADVDAMEGRRPLNEVAYNHPLNRFIRRFWAGPPYHVDRQLAEGDEVAGFRVVHAPGHTPGQAIYFRESDRVAICGDVIRNLNFATMTAGLAEPPSIFTANPVQNRRSIRKLAGLKPALILPGHGSPVTDLERWEQFLATLPGD